MFFNHADKNAAWNIKKECHVRNWLFTDLKIYLALKVRLKLDLGCTKRFIPYLTSS